VPLPGGPAVDPDTLITIARACRAREQLRFGYRGRDGEPGERLTEPHRLVQAGYRWYLVARDVARDQWRTYRVDRVQSPEPTGRRFVPRDPPDAAAFVAHAVTTAPYRYQARVLLRAPAAAIAARLPPTVGTVEPAGEDGCLLSTGAESLDALAFHLGHLGCEFTVLGPPELIERVRTLAGRWLRATTATA
jgi:predicted DNA-binding transcriptional regulator YafY